MIPYSLFEALKVQDQGLHRCPITATMKIPEKSSTSYPIYLEAPTFNVRKKWSVFIGLHSDGVKSMHETLLGEFLNGIANANWSV